jgi:hypothetical protein
MYRSSPFYFLGLFGLAIAAFWPQYLFAKRYETDWHVHLHGVAMFAWMVLLLSQAWLIRSGRRPVHRALGRISFVLVPVMVASTILLAHYRLREAVTDERVYFLAVQLALIATLAFAYGLAIANRKRPVVHMRYMVCTALPLIDPILARILFFTVALPPPMLQVVTYGITDAILLGLAWMDWRSRRPERVYLTVLPVFIALQAPTFFLYRLEAWHAFSRWFAALPLP